jgi:hypothetical protein
MANGFISREALLSGQYYTRFTEEAERIAGKATGIYINSDLTRMEYNIEPLNPHVAVTSRKEQEVSALNNSILNQTKEFAQFKSEVLASQSSCKIASFIYTADLEHVLGEAQKYVEILIGLQNKDSNVLDDYKDFWTHNMSDHAKTMRGLFDPTEKKYFDTANQFAQIFDSLLQNMSTPEIDVLSATKAISEFKADTTQGIIECRVKSLMLPLYTDHLLREANHFIFLMQ